MTTPPNATPRIDAETLAQALKAGRDARAHAASELFSALFGSADAAPPAPARATPARI